MADPTFVKGGTTLTFKPGNIQALRLPESPRQRKLVSSDGTVRTLEVSTTDDRFIEILIKQLPLSDVGGYAGQNSLRTFILTTLNWAENTFTFTDTDSDAFTVRYWGEEFNLQEVKLDVFEGALLLREEV